MSQNRNIFDENRIRGLAQSFFDATISPGELEELLGIARALSMPGADGISSLDAGLLDDLRMLASLSDYSTAVTNHVSQCAPDYLEQMLDRHISELAGKEKVKRGKWKHVLARVSGVAAAIALMVTLGLHYVDIADDSHGRENGDRLALAVMPEKVATPTSAGEPTSPANQASPGKLSSEGSEISAKGIPSHEENMAALATTTNCGSRESGHRKVKTSSRKNGKSEVKKTEADISRHDVDQAVMQQAVLALNIIPEISEDVKMVIPAVGAASVEASEALAPSLTTLSQVVDNVYESVTLMQQVFSGIKESMGTVGQTLASISQPI